MPCNNSASPAIDHYQIDHLRALMHHNITRIDLPLQRLISTQQQLLPRLPSSVKRSRHLCATERPVRQRAAVFTRERNALRHALIDDAHADLRQPVDVSFPRSKIPTLHRVVKQSVNAVAVILIILSRVDAALRRGEYCKQKQLT